MLRLIDLRSSRCECGSMRLGRNLQPGRQMRSILLPALLLILGACTTTQIMGSGEMAAVAPMLSVERFLQAANDRDLEGMARIFGTEDGPVIETGSTFGCMFKKMGSWIGMGDRCQTMQEVEITMDLLAQVLTHEDYTIASEANVPGRSHPTTRIGVDMTVRGQRYTDVPFIVVRGGENRWFIEEIGLERITGQ